MATKQEKETLRLAQRKARLSASLKENLKRRRTPSKKKNETPAEPVDLALSQSKNEG